MSKNSFYINTQQWIWIFFSDGQNANATLPWGRSLAGRSKWRNEGEVPAITSASEMTPETCEAKEQDRELTLAWFAGTMGQHSSLEVVIARVGGEVVSDTLGVDLQRKCGCGCRIMLKHKKKKPLGKAKRAHFHFWWYVLYCIVFGLLCLSKWCRTCIQGTISALYIFLV